MALGEVGVTEVQVGRLGAVEELAEGDPVVRLILIHISEPTRLLSISYAAFCLKKKKQQADTVRTFRPLS